MPPRSTTARTNLAASMLLAAATGPTLAAEISTEGDLLADIPLVNAVSGFAQRPEQAPASVTIIDRALIELSGAQNFVDIFRLVPGFQSYHVSHNRYGISYHGIGREFANQMEVMVDGRSVYETIFSTVNWGTLGIELADIDHIEIVRGSNAPMQGSNAFMGSVNIVTRKPVQDSGLSLRSTLGDLGTRNASLRYNDSLGAVDYRLSLGYQHSDGFPAVPEEGFLGDGRELFHGNARGTYTPTLQDTVEVQLGFAQDRADWYEGSEPVPMSQSEFTSHFQAVNWTRSLASGSEVEVKAYHNRLKARNFVPLGPFYPFLGLDKATADFLTAVKPTPQPIIDLVRGMTGLDAGNALALIGALNMEVSSGFGNLLSERHDVEFKHSLEPSERLRAAWGLGARRDGFEAAHPFGFNADVRENYWRAFAHGEWQASGWLTLNAGAMVEDTFVGTLVSPRVSANVALDPRHFLRVGYARGNRAPSLVEANEASIASVNGLVFDILRLSDPNLHEERLESFEIAYLFRGADPGLNFDLRLFDEKVSDVIDDLREPTTPPVSLFDSNLRRFENNGYWRFRGAELQLDSQLTDSTFARLHYTNTDMDSRMLRERLPAPVWMTRDDRMARHSAGLLLGQRLSESWTLSLLTYHQSALRWEDGSDTDSFTRVDAQLAWRFSAGHSDGVVKLVAQNLGSNYAEFDPTNQFETRVFLSAEVNLP
ncbi:MAG: TonB-dependent receptor [Porticoccaceae bacterium]|nr:TonB-dependent receptor [Porticoccaceae bacterium]